MASASEVIVPATSVGNITVEDHQNSTYITTVKNIRILHGLLIPFSRYADNIRKEEVAGHESKHEDRHKNNSVSSKVVLVLVDPREAGYGGDVEGNLLWKA